MHLMLLVSSISITYGLECYTTFDERHNHCSHKDVRHFSDSASECCQSSSAVAYSVEIPLENGSIPCQPCKKIREEVYCFQEIWWIGERSCHELHPDMTTIEDCCVRRGAHVNQKAGGFHFRKRLMNASVPTYTCVPCSEVVVNATKWTAWSPCNTTCGGGYKTRQKTCAEVTSVSICNGKASEIENCNDHPCSESFSPIMIALITITSVLAIVLLVVLIYKCFKKRSYPSIESAVAAKTATNNPRQTFELSNVPSTPRYQTAPTRKRSLPFVPSENAPTKFPDGHIYADVYNNEEISDYLPMSKQSFR